MDFINKSVIFKTKLATKTKDDFISDVLCVSEKLKHFESVEIFLSNNYDFIVSLFATIKVGAKAFILSKENATLNAKCVINDNNISGFLSDSKCKAKDSSDFSIDVNALFFIQTSGSSKEYSDIIPKTLQQMILESTSIAKTLTLNTSDIFISSPSHQHLFALTFKIFLPLLQGGIIIDSTLKFPELVIEFCKNHTSKNIIFITTPTLLKYLCEHNLLALSPIKTIISAGAKLDSAIRIAIKNALNLDIFEVYGSTECGVMAFNTSDYFRAFCGVKLKLNGDSRLIISSSWALEKDFLSNDLAEINNDKIYLKGRIDRIVKIHDKRISLDFLESQIKKLDIILDCCVGVANNRPCCILVLNENGKKLFLNKGKKGVIDFIKRQKIRDIRSFYIRKSLPFNNQGKITKKDFIASINEKALPILSVVKSDECYLKAKGEVDCGSFIFDGHFANFPLVAGFIELDFVVNLAKQYFQLSDIFEIESVKFTSFLRPYDEVEIEIFSKNAKLYFHILANNKECANGKISQK